MLNYIGPNLGASPAAAMIIPGMPVTMPAGIPGVGPTPALLPPMPPIHGAAPPPPSALAAILRKPGGPPGVPQPPPPPPEYVTTTQPDGSILLRIKLPDGTVGPIVKILPPIKHALNPHLPPNISPGAQG